MKPASLAFLTALRQSSALSRHGLSACGVLIAALALSAAALSPAGAASRKVLQLPKGHAALQKLTKSDADADADKVMLQRADSGTYDSDKNILSVEGHVEIDYQGRILMADKVVYDLNKDQVTASGNVSVMDEQGNVVFAKRVMLKNKLRDGALEGFGALLGKYGRLAAVSAKRSNAGKLTEARQAVYTNCAICTRADKEDRTPLWQIKSFKVIHDGVSHRVIFTDATLEFMGVPVLYTPYLNLPDPSVHHASGFLTPDIGNSSSLGYFVRVPYYYSLSDSEDLTVEPLVSTDGGQMLEAEYRQRWENSGMWLQGSVAHNPNGGVDENQDQIYSHIFGSGRFALTDGWTPGKGWQTGFDTQVTSKDTYLKRYDISQADRLKSDLFLVGENGRSRFAITGYAFQSLRLSDDNGTFPVLLPLIEYDYVPLHKYFGGQFGVHVNSASVARLSGTDDQRLTTQVNWRKPFVLPDGELWTFTLNARGDYYHTDSPLTAAGKHNIWRGMPTAEFDWRWPFIARGRGAHSVVLEPIAQFIAAPYGGNPDTVPDEDSVSMEIDENNLFSMDHVAGYDLIDSGPRANFGMRSEVRFPEGYIEGLLGQSFRLKDNDIFTDGSGQEGKTSDLVGRFSVKFPPHIDLTERIAYDEISGKVRRNEVYLTGTYHRSSLQVNYIQLSKSTDLSAREEINGQMDVNFYENWQAFAAVRRDLIADETLSSEFGLGYEDECFGISVAYRRKYTSDRDLKPSTALLFHFSLKTSGQPIQAFSLFPQDVFSYSHS